MTTARAVGIVSIITLFVKITGFIREMVIAHGYGAGIEVDAFRVAQGIPLILYTCVGSSLAIVFVPLFSELLQKEGKVKAHGFTNCLATIAIFATFAVVLIGILGSSWMVRMIAPGFGEEALNLATKLTRILIPGLFFSTMAGLAAGVLQSSGKFAVPALMAFPGNLVVIGSVLLFGNQFGIWALCVATLVGASLSLFVQWPSLRKNGYRFKMDLNLHDPLIAKVGVLIAPVILGNSILQINAMAERMFASRLPIGSIAILDYCNRLTSLVIGIVITAAATVALPKFSRLLASQEKHLFAAKFGQALSFMNAIIIPMSIGLIVLRTPIVRFVYERGAFTSQDSELTALALLYASMSLVGWSMREIAARAFYALKDTSTPVINGIIAMVINIALLFLFVGRLKWGLAGMTAASSCSATFAGILLIYLLRRKVGGIGLRSILSSFWRSMLAGLLMGLVVWKVYPIFSRVIVGSGFISQFCELGLTTIIGAAVYILGLTLLHSKEAQYGWTLMGKMGSRIVIKKG